MPFGNEQQQILNENDVNCGNISTVPIIFIACFNPFTGHDESTNWPASNAWVFIAQLVEHCRANARAMS